MRLNRNCKAIADFYRSKDWQVARAIKIESAHGLCEKCGAIGTEVHHKIHLTPKNVTDPNITINGVRFVKEKYGVEMELDEIECEFSSWNKQCIGTRCPFHK